MQRLLGIAQGEHADDEKERFHPPFLPRALPRCHPIIGPHPARMSRPEKYHPTDMELPRIRPGSALPASAAVLVSTHILWGKTSIPSPGRAVPPGRWAGGATTARFSDRRGQALRIPTRRPDHGRARGCSSSSRPLGPTSGRCVTPDPKGGRTRGGIESGPASRRDEGQPGGAPAIPGAPARGAVVPAEPRPGPGGRRPDAGRGGLRGRQAAARRHEGRVAILRHPRPREPRGRGREPRRRHPQQRRQVVPARILRGLAGLLLRQPGVSFRIARQAEAHHPRRARTSRGASSRRSPRSTRSGSRRRPGPSGSGGRSSTRTWPTR